MAWNCQIRIQQVILLVTRKKSAQKERSKPSYGKKTLKHKKINREHCKIVFFCKNCPGYFFIFWRLANKKQNTVNCSVFDAPFPIENDNWRWRQLTDRRFAQLCLEAASRTDFWRTLHTATFTIRWNIFSDTFHMKKLLFSTTWLGSVLRSWFLMKS